jgi:methyl-accepting chemotaxis protein
MMENLVPFFIAITTIAVVLQAGILVALFLMVRKTTTKLEATVEDIKVKTLPTIESANLMLSELHPKLAEIADSVVELQPQVRVVVDNLVETTSAVRSQVQRVDATVSDAMDRARLQIIRADEMLTRTFDRVEQTSDMVTNTVISPVRQVSGIVRGVTAGIEFLLGNRTRKNGDSRAQRRPVPQDEMFI